jgi:hypothetical protein
MKKSIVIFVAIAVLVLGYVLGNFFPLITSKCGDQNRPGKLNLPFLQDQGIKGDANLEVILEMDNGQPLGNVEVDLAETPGPPPVGGVAISDSIGLAGFNVKPGNYFIFFNDNNFPKNVKTAEPQAVEVKEGEVNQVKIILTVK